MTQLDNELYFYCAIDEAVSEIRNISDIPYLKKLRREFKLHSKRNKSDTDTCLYLIKRVDEHIVEVERFLIGIKKHMVNNPNYQRGIESMTKRAYAL